MIPKSSYPSDQKILRVVSINVNGLRSAEKKGIFDWIAQSDADVILYARSLGLPTNNGQINLSPEGWYTSPVPCRTSRLCRYCDL